MMLFNYLVLIIDISICIYMMHIIGSKVSGYNFNSMFKLGLWIASIGLAGQAIRNFLFIIYGVSPSDNELPLWVLKDIGIWIIGISYILNKDKV